MRVLACSDIHGNVDAVQRMRSCETNEYDLVIVAGDIGHTASDVFSILVTFGCPVAYVLGNHDYAADYCEFHGPSVRHLHDNPLEIGDYFIVGFSGCPTNWGNNPSASASAEAGALPHDEILKRNVSNAARHFDRLWRRGRFGVVVTHEYVAFPNRHFPKAALMIHGHNHKFHDRIVTRMRVLNVAGLDLPFSVGPESGAREWGDYRQVNAGCYVTFIIERGELSEVKAHRFGYDLTGYRRIPDTRVVGSPYVAADPSRDAIERGIS